MLGCLSALAWMVAGAVLLRSRMEWRAGAVPVVATICALEGSEARDKNGETSRAVYVRYTYTDPTDGTQRTGKSSMASDPPIGQVGEALPVLVHPTAAVSTRPEGFAELYLLPTALLAMGALFLLVTLVVLWVYRRLRKR